MVRKLTERGTITIPKKTLEHIGCRPGDYFEISDDGYRIILIPKRVEDRFSEEEWEKLENIAKERGVVYKSGREAKRHLERLSK